MDVGAILKWGLLAVAAIWAVRFITGLMGSAMNADNGPDPGPPANGVVWAYPGLVYPDPGVRGGGYRRGRGRNGRGR